MLSETENPSQTIPLHKKKYVRKNKSKAPNHDKAVGDMTITELKEALLFYRQKIEDIQALLKEVTIETRPTNINMYGGVSLYGNSPQQLAEEKIRPNTPSFYSPPILNRSVDSIENSLVEYGGTPTDSFVGILEPGLHEDEDY